LDSIGEIGFGISLHCLDSLEGGGKALPFATAFDRAQALCMGRLGRPGVVRRLGWFLKPEQELRQCVRTMDVFTSGVIADRRKHCLDDKTDLLSLFMAYRSEDATEEIRPESFSDKFLKDVVMSFFIAGRDTTASTLTFTFWLLSQNPEIQSALLQEIDAVCPNGSTPTYDMVKGSSTLPYLDGVIKEVLRLFPPVPVDPKFAVGSCTLPSGYYVPPRCIVFYQPYVMGRSPELYPDPLVMDPLRWVGQPEPSHYRFPVFQAGKRICLGMSMAMMEVKLLTIMVLQAFTLGVVKMGSNDNINFSLALTLSVEGGLYVKVQPRF
jgi:cytochrome P450